MSRDALHRPPHSSCRDDERSEDVEKRRKPRTIGLSKFWSLSSDFDHFAKAEVGLPKLPDASARRIGSMLETEALVEECWVQRKASLQNPRTSSTLPLPPSSLPQLLASTHTHRLSLLDGRLREACRLLGE